MKTMLNLKTMSILSKSELRALKGGQLQLDCYCGFDSSVHHIDVSAPSLQDALNAMVKVCQGKGATCNGK